MKLYRLKHKHTGKFLAACSMFGKPQWTKTGVFYRKIDTIKKHADCICRDWELVFRGSGPVRCFAKEKSFHPERMDDLVVVVNDVTLHGETEISAIEIFNPKQ